MATTLYGSYTNLPVFSIGGSVIVKIRPWITYTIIDRSQYADYQVQISAGYQYSVSGGSYTAHEDVKISVSGTSQTSQSKTIRTSGTISSGSTKSGTIISTYIWTWKKTHSKQSVTIKVGGSSTDPYDSTNTTSLSSKSVTFSIPAKPTYSVTYEADGGSNVPSTQTKYCDETLVLSGNIPTLSARDNIQYTFKGWSTTNPTTIGTGTVTHKPKAYYTTNSALALHAVWGIDYKKPTIGKIIAKRSKRVEGEGGTITYDLDDEGTYMNITVPWTIDKSAYLNNKIASVTVKSTNISDSTETAINTYTIISNDSTGTFTMDGIGGSFNINSTYSLEITVTDDHGSTTMTNFLSSSFFIMDVSEGGYGIGFGTAAPEKTSPSDAELWIGTLARAFRSIIFEDANNVVPKGTSEARINSEWYTNSNSQNMYYRVPGYHAFHINGTGKFYVYSDKVKATVDIEDGNGNTIPKLETPSITFATATQGTRRGYAIRKYGNVVWLHLEVSNNNDVASGSNIYNCFINTVSLRPIRTTTNGSFWGSHSVGGLIYHSGEIVVRNASTSAFKPYYNSDSDKSTVGISFTYIVDN